MTQSKDNGAKWPPRMVLGANTNGIIEAVSLSYVFQPFPEKPKEYLSIAEHEHLLEKSQADKAAAVAEGKVAGARMLASYIEDMASLRTTELMWKYVHDLEAEREKAARLVEER